MKKTLTGLGIIAALGGTIWVATAPPSYYEPAGPRTVGSMPDEVRQADIGDVIKTRLISLVPELPGHDEILALPGTDKVLVSGRDEWIWLVDTEERTAQRLAYSPVSPTGAHVVPGRADQIYFCMARLDYHEYEHNPGLYMLDLNTKKFTEIATRVPLTGRLREDGLELPNFERVFVVKASRTKGPVFLVTLPAVMAAMPLVSDSLYVVLPESHA